MSDKKYIYYPSFDRSLLSLISDHDLIVTDLDDVVITTGQYFCGSLWFSKEIKKANINKEAAISVFYDCINSSSILPVSNELNEHFSLLAQKSDKAVIGLTARDRGIKANTDKAIKQVGVYLSNISHPFINDGIIYGGSDPHTGKAKNKGAILDDLLSSPIFSWVKKILFIDDSHQNTLHVKHHLWDNEQMVTIVYFTEVENRFYCNYSLEELDLLGYHQYNHFIDTGYCKSDQDIIGETCPNISKNNYETTLYGEYN